MTHINQLLELPIGSAIVVHTDSELTGDPTREVFVLRRTVHPGAVVRYWHAVEAGVDFIDTAMVNYLSDDHTKVYGFDRLVDIEKTVDRSELHEIYNRANEGMGRPGVSGRKVLDELMQDLFDLLDLDPTPATQAEVTSVETIINGGNPL